MSENPKVFISYTHDSKEHQNRVLDFSNKLRGEGIDSILDQYEESPPEGWPRWMDRQIRNADYVIMICTPTYYKRVMGEEETGKGLGGVWEGNLIYQHLYNDGGINNKFVPVLLGDGVYQDIPAPLQGATFYDIDDTDRYDRLYWRLRGVTSFERPPLGELKPLLEKERKTLFITTLIDLDAWDNGIWRGCAYLTAPNNNFSPALVLLFEQQKYAEIIAKQWNEILGDYDKNNELRIAIISDDIKGEEAGYFVHVGTNIDSVIKRYKGAGSEIPGDIFMHIDRFHRMHPDPKEDNFGRFMRNFKATNDYFVKIGYIGEKGIVILDILETRKEELIVRNIKEVESKNDPDGCILDVYERLKK